MTITAGFRVEGTKVYDGDKLVAYVAQKRSGYRGDGRIRARNTSGGATYWKLLQPGTTGWSGAHRTRKAALEFLRTRIELEDWWQ